MLDLLHTAARLLRMDGKLVYLIPTTYDFTVDDLPKHPCLQIKYLCQQPLSSRHGRHAVVMVKTREYSPELEEEYRQYKALVLSGQDTGFGKLKRKLELALSAAAILNTDVVKNISSSALKRKEGRARRKQLFLEQQKSQTAEDIGVAIDASTSAETEGEL